jgi:twitching motility protein PilI
MSKRLSLKAMQERLALRLQEARDQGVSSVWLGVEVNQRRCLLPLVQAGEIMSWIAPHPVPYTQPWYMGVVNHRGDLLGLLDLAAFLADQEDLPPPAPASERLGNESRLVGLHQALGINAVLWVDRLTGLHSPAQFVQCEAPPPEAAPWQGQRLTDNQQQVWQEINLMGLCSMPAFLAVSA